MGEAKVYLTGNILTLTYVGEITMENLKTQHEEARKILVKAPPNLRAVYDARKMTTAQMSEAMMERKFITEDVAPKVVKGAGIVSNALVGFLGKVAIALTSNHKLFYGHEYDKALEWVKS